MKYKTFRLFAGAGWVLLATNYVMAQVLAPVTPLAAPGATATVEQSRSIDDWLMRMHEAAQKRAYVGTFVVSSGASLSSAKIWNVCEGNQHMERIETLTGAPHSIFRHNDQVITFMPEQKLARSETRESSGIFPELPRPTERRVADFYQLRQNGIERVAGVEANIIELVPRDNLRFGYRVWTEKKTDLVVKLQTLGTDGNVLEQAAFSELQLGAPVKMDQLIQLMGKVEGYRIEKLVLVKTTANAEGWALSEPVAGFEPVRCYRRLVNAQKSPPGNGPLQWVFSDGLASVSIFVEPMDRQRQVGKSSRLSLGATQTMTKQMDPYWITVMGEVPMATLQLFANRLERRKP
ncbi:MAG: MucB/RseB C-terminal domain-containing protein [Polaromonas sp.]|nr:MucB/RseB C-terminal domain-containing protein [Polaromonas sp.]